MGASLRVKSIGTTSISPQLVRSPRRELTSSKFNYNRASSKFSSAASLHLIPVKVHNLASLSSFAILVPSQVDFHYVT